VFLPAAERYHLMSRIDRFVVQHALQVLHDTPGLLASLGCCSINLSGQSLGDDDFLDFVLRQLDRTRVSPRKICFEITETAAIGNLQAASSLISTLKQIGCSFALDDFGSGLSSFAYLRSLPVDYLKIDGVFVKDIADDPIDRALVRSINEVARVMGKRTIAEFVESEDILMELRAIGVDYAQGLCVGPPVALGDIGFLRRVS
jgi:EAL domain-containing protein (putative c-di-GMP-specific phosphodiesterase class I)